MQLKQLKIGNITLRNNLILAPMAGVTDFIFRNIVWEFGIGLTVSEMVSAKSIVYGNKNTMRLLENNQSPWAVQFFGHEPDILAEAIKRLDENGVLFDIVDINMGCPMPKIVNNSDGASLARNPVLAGKMIESAVKASSKPVTIKIRLGFTSDTINALEMALIAQESGASLVAIHGRTRDQYYAGEANWDEIISVKNILKIPVIGNGDIFTPECAKKRLEESNCDGIMLARGVMGNPWLVSRTIKYLETGIISPPPNTEEIINLAIRHLRMVEAHPFARIEEMRKHVSWYTKGLKGSAEVRRKINTAKTCDEMEDILNSLT